MKVALDLQPCYWDRSGIGTYTYELAKRIHNTADMEFFGNIFNFLGRKDNSELLSGITMPVQENKLLTYGVYRRLWYYLPLHYRYMFRKTADLSVFFNFISPKEIDGRVITVMHDLSYIRYPETLKPSNLKHLTKGMPHSVAQSDRIITDSEFQKIELQELLHIPEEKISVVYIAASLEEESAEEADVREKYGIHGEYILFVGTIEPRKNIGRLLQAFDLLKSERKLPHKLVLAGGKGWQDDGIFQIVNQLSHKEDVIFTGYVSGAEKNTLYQHAEAFVYSSIYEGFGIPPLEAMAWGCPVVCTNAASVPEVVGDAARLIDPFSIESIAEGILHVLSDREYAKELVARGYVQEKRFSWDNTAKQFMDICKDVLENS